MYIFSLFYFLFLVVSHSLQDLNSPATDWTWAPAVKVLCPNHCMAREFPKTEIFILPAYKTHKWQICPELLSATPYVCLYISLDYE